ncbi:enoyl-CoA hydratase/isomerase family protein [Alphaproteobacteria bacterium]|nr:enoyl-CoA hydratase/isomerase family protein [Alphaproteobacteria bacterium]
MENELITRIVGHCGHIVLNRPNALNALTLNMVRQLDTVLRQWSQDDAVLHVLIEGSGEKGFCAGGDIRALHDWGKSGAPEATGFYREEYVVNHLIKTFPKPYVALMDGVTMGGGVGVSVHGTYRIVTDRTVFAMPETGIGLLPDVGGTYFLPRLKGKIGTYMALTGARLKAKDCLYAGIATHYVSESEKEALRLAILECHDIAKVLAPFAHMPDDAPILSYQADIDRLFQGQTVLEILGALKADGGEWAQSQADIIAQKSPTSCAVALEQMHRGSVADFETCLSLEMRAVTRIMSGHDFYEGVRAVIIEKDNNPKWQPATFEDISINNISDMFETLGDKDLILN